MTDVYAPSAALFALQLHPQEKQVSFQAAVQQAEAAYHLKARCPTTIRCLT